MICPYSFLIVSVLCHHFIDPAHIIAGADLFVRHRSGPSHGVEAAVFRPVAKGLEAEFPRYAPVVFDGNIGHGRPFTWEALSAPASGIQDSAASPPVDGKIRDFALIWRRGGCRFFFSPLHHPQRTAAIVIRIFQLGMELRPAGSPDDVPDPKQVLLVLLFRDRDGEGPVAVGQKEIVPGQGMRPVVQPITPHV